MLFRSMRKLTFDCADFPMLGRLTGMDVLAWLREHHAVHGWFMCYDADDELLRARQQSCLAHLMGADLASTQAAVKSSGLIGLGVRAAKRLELLGARGLWQNQVRISLCCICTNVGVVR